MDNNIICATAYSSIHFNRSDEDPNTITAFASDLCRGHPLVRVYNDACDEGFFIRGEKTGNRVLFALWHEETKDGDVRWWELRPMRSSHKLNDDTKAMKVIVWND